MLIRREDKELIHNLALLGAFFGACLCVFLTVHMSNKAHEQHKENNEYQETNAAIAKLSSSSASPEKPVVDENILQQVQEHIQQEQPDNEAAKKSFWIELPQWGFWGICAGGGLVGAIAGFSGIWVSGWTGSVILYGLIRLFYKIIRKIAPNSAAAKLTQRSSSQTDHQAFERSQERIFPTLVKLTFILLGALGALAIVMWKVTGL